MTRDEFDKAVDILIIAGAVGLIIKKDADGQLIVCTNLRDAGTGGDSRFVPLESAS